MWHVYTLYSLTRFETNVPTANLIHYIGLWFVFFASNKLNWVGECIELCCFNKINQPSEFYCCTYKNIFIPGITI